MNCAVCQSEGISSDTMPKNTRATLLKWGPVIDDKGKTHYHDPNTYNVEYVCSRKHNWTSTQTKSCWCGWQPAVQISFPPLPSVFTIRGRKFPLPGTTADGGNIERFLAGIFMSLYSLNNPQVDEILKAIDPVIIEPNGTKHIFFPKEANPK